MYLRTISRKNTDGSVVRYYQLAENVWDPVKRCAVAKVHFSFGRGDQLDRAGMERLARSILRVFASEDTLERRAGETWRNILAQLDTIKVVEYERGGARVVQTTEIRPTVASLLKSLSVAPPPRLHRVSPSQAA